jgi:hypothetical protein
LTQTSPLGRSYATTPLPPLGQDPVPDPDLTTVVRARLHRLRQHTRRPGGHCQTTGPPEQAHQPTG